MVCLLFPYYLILCEYWCLRVGTAPSGAELLPARITTAKMKQQPPVSPTKGTTVLYVCYVLVADLLLCPPVSRLASFAAAHPFSDDPRGHHNGTFVLKPRPRSGAGYRDLEDSNFYHDTHNDSDVLDESWEWDGEGESPFSPPDHVGDGLVDAEVPYDEDENVSEEDRQEDEEDNEGTDKDVVQQFLEQVEKYERNKANCTAGTHHNLGKGVIKQYGLNRFKAQALVAVNRANLLSRIWKHGNPAILNSEYFFFTQVRSMLEGDPEIFAAGNCYDQAEFKDYYLFCPYAYRTADGTINVKDLSVEYDYLGNSSEWFYSARQRASDLRNFSVTYGW